MEKDVEAYLRGKVKEKGGLALKWVSPGYDGVPDRMVLLPGGRLIFAELKDAGKKPRKKQRLRHAALRALGFKVFVPDSRDSVDQMLKEVMPDDVQTS